MFLANRGGYQYLERDVFLDYDRSEAAIERAFRKSIRWAKLRGKAIAIGHPYKETLRVLKKGLPGLKEQGGRLVTLSALLPRPPVRPPQPAAIP